MPRYKNPRNQEEEIELEARKAAVKVASYARKNAARNRKRREASKPCQYLGDLREPRSGVPNVKAKNSRKVKSSETSNLSKRATVLLPTEMLMNKGSIIEEPSGYDLDYQNSGIQWSVEEMKEMEHEAQNANNEDKIKERQSKIIFKNEDYDENWFAKEGLIHKAFVSSHALSNHVICDSCGVHLSTVVRCTDCMQHLCSQCDTELHVRNPFHYRKLFLGELSNRILLSEEFVNCNGNLKTINVPVPLLKPSTCMNCHEVGSLKVTASSQSCVVINEKGRFDLHLTSFECCKCETSYPADIEHYIASSLWPGSPIRCSYFFSASLLRFWFHLKFLTPGTSEQKFLESIAAVTHESGRVSTISKLLFNRASKAFDYHNYLIDIRVRKIDRTNCRACSLPCGKPSPHSCHADGNHKLVLRQKANQRPNRSWYGSGIFVSEEEFSALKDKFDKVKPQAKSSLGAKKCGNSLFKASKEVSTRYKNLQVTGTVMASCGHGVIGCAVNMTEGETYRHTLCAHIKFSEKNCRFFVNDVVCHYWPWLKKLGEILPEFKPLSQNMVPFLSRLHGQAHGWYCQVLYFGHWRDGAAGTIGEEQEQVFSLFSRYNIVTKIMTPSNRIDFLTLAMHYWNKRKESTLALTITKRLLIALYRSTFYKEKLEELLRKRMLNENELPAIQESLESAALFYLNCHKKSPSHLSDLQNELENIHFEFITLHDRITSVANTCKWKTKLRRKQTTLITKVKKLTAEINEISDEKVTHQHFLNGIFPWDSASHVSFKENFKLIDIWMLKKRNEEQIQLSKKEMFQFVQSIARDIRRHQQEISNYTENSKICLEKVIYSSSLIAGEILIKSSEIAALKRLMKDAFLYQKYFHNSDWDSCLLDDDDDNDDDDDDDDDDNDDDDDDNDDDDNNKD